MYSGDEDYGDEVTGGLSGQEVTAMGKWPRLSETLRGRVPGACQECGRTEAHAPPAKLTYWRECDDSDRETHRFIVLCRSCADRIIEPHPRLYREQPRDTPMPGVMEICNDCKHRAGLACESPTARFNGGPGLAFEPPGQWVHLCRSPRSKSGWYWLTGGPVTGCSGKEGGE